MATSIAASSMTFVICSRRTDSRKCRPRRCGWKRPCAERKGSHSEYFSLRNRRALRIFSISLVCPWMSSWALARISGVGVVRLPSFAYQAATSAQL